MRQKVTSSTSRTTTASSSELAPRQQPEACWLWVPTAYVSGLLVPFGSCLYSDLSFIRFRMMYCWDSVLCLSFVPCSVYELCTYLFLCVVQSYVVISLCVVCPCNLCIVRVWGCTGRQAPRSDTGPRCGFIPWDVSYSWGQRLGTPVWIRDHEGSQVAVRVSYSGGRQTWYQSMDCL